MFLTHSSYFEVAFLGAIKNKDSLIPFPVGHPTLMIFYNQRCKTVTGRKLFIKAKLPLGIACQESENCINQTLLGLLHKHYWGRLMKRSSKLNCLTNYFTIYCNFSATVVGLVEIFWMNFPVKKKCTLKINKLKTQAGLTLSKSESGLSTTR